MNLCVGGQSASDRGYVGRFAPSPTGPLHAGSLVAAVASFLDARAHHGRWLLRIEDVDTPRVQRGATESIMEVLSRLGMQPDAPPSFQSANLKHYAAALDALRTAGKVYPCGCTRKEIEENQAFLGLNLSRHKTAVYPGTCRERDLEFEHHAIRIALPTACGIEFIDQHLGTQSQDLTHEVGDFVLRRADGLFTYQLAVVVDDDKQGITHVVRGADLLSNTARQIYLQQCLGYSTLNYLHLPLVTNSAGEKLSKQTKASPIDISHPEAIRASLRMAATHLGLSETEVGSNLPQWLTEKVSEWQVRWRS
jgi:glutamyl-Q tRNA(Asp) synthetase